MKKYSALIAGIALIFLMGCANTEANNNENLNWIINLEEAVKIAEESDKNILVNFTGSDWCQWCIKLNNEVFSKDQFTEYANDNLVLVKIDFPRRKELSQEEQLYNRNLAQKFGIRGFPTILLLNKTGEFVSKTGYQPGGADNYIKHIEKYYANN